MNRYLVAVELFGGIALAALVRLWRRGSLRFGRFLFIRMSDHQTAGRDVVVGPSGATASGGSSASRPASRLQLGDRQVYDINERRR